MTEKTASLVERFVRRIDAGAGVLAENTIGGVGIVAVTRFNRDNILSIVENRGE